MRDIEFRGKTVKSKEWIYGSFVTRKNRSWIHFYDVNNFECLYEVDESTVGQYTGLKDKNGVEIYERDIVKRKFAFYQDVSEVVFDNDTAAFGMVSIKELDNQSISTFKKGRRVSFNKNFVDGYDYVEVIGNIYENKDLVK